MPIYEYDCPVCGARFEKLVKSVTTAPPPPACPTCGATQTEKARSTFAVGAASATQSNSAPAGGMCGCGRVPGSCGSRA